MSNLEYKKKYSSEMDVLKALGTIYIIVSHSGSFLSHFFYQFHVPLFFFVSGFFYKSEYVDKQVKFVLSRIKTLYIPFLCYQIPFLLGHNIFYKFNMYSDFYDMKTMLLRLLKIFSFQSEEKLLGVFWFIPVLFMSLLLFNILRRVIAFSNRAVSEKLFFLFVIFLFGVAMYCAFSGYILPRNFLIAFIALPIVYSGYLYKKYYEAIPLKIEYAAIAVVLLLISLPFGNINMVSYRYIDPFFFLGCSIAGIYLNLYVAKFSFFQKSPLILFVAKNSLHLLAFHFVAFKLITIIQIKIYNLPLKELSVFPFLDIGGWWWIAYSITGFILPLIIVKGIVSLKVRIAS